MGHAIQFAVLGLASGGIYALLALGLIAIFRATGAVNFGHAAVAVGAGYVLVDLNSHHVPTPVAIGLSVCAGAAFGTLIELMVMRPLRHATALVKAIATLGVLIIVQSGCQLWFGSNPQIVHPFLPQDGFTFLGAHLTLDYVIILLISVLLTAALWAVSRHTRPGIATVALSENESALESLGWSGTLLAQFNWALAGVLAAVAGVLAAPILGVSLSSMETLLIPALAAALVGNLSSFLLALVGGLSIGVVQSELTYYGQSSVLKSVPQLSAAVPFLVIIVVLMVRGRSIPARDWAGARLPSIGSGRLRAPVAIPVIALAVVLIQIVLPTDWVLAVTSCLIAGVVLLSLVVLTGYAGQLSLAQVAIGGVGALIAAQLVAKADLPLPAAAVIGIATAIPVGVIVGLPAARTRGVTLAVVTLGLATALDALVFSSVSITGGDAGIPVGFTTVFGLDIDETTFPRRYSLFALFLFVVLGLGIRNIRRSEIGRRLIAVRSNERAAASLGIDVVMTKLYAFVVSACIATVGGLLIAFRYPTALFNNFDPFQSVNYAVESAIGGVGYASGAAAGTLTEQSGIGNKVLNNFGLGNWLLLVGGVLLVLTLILNPDGIVGGILKQTEPLRRRLSDRFRRTRRQSDAQMVATAVRVTADADETAAPSARISPRPQTTATLSVERLSVAFGAVTALDQVDLTLTSGQILGIIGPNGAGKTTLIDAITGYVASTGTIRLNERDIHKAAPHRRALAGITRSFQSLELFEDLSVLENLLVSSQRPHWSRRLSALIAPGTMRLDPATSETATDLGLDRMLDQSPGDLPYGTRRLLAIVRAVATRPTVLLLDEPAAGLGEAGRHELRGLLRRLADELHLAVLVIEHDVELVMSVSDQVMALNFGKVIAAGTPDEVRRHPEVIRSYLGVDVDDADDADLTPGLTAAEAG